MSDAARWELEIHFGLREDEEPFLYEDCFLYDCDLASLIASTTIPPTGHKYSRECDWLGQAHHCLCEYDGCIMKEDPDNVDHEFSCVSEYYVFGENGELLREACITGFTDRSVSDFLEAGEVEWRRRLFGPPRLMRMPNERRPLTADEAWGCWGALMRAFVRLRPSLYKLADVSALDASYDLALDLRRLAVRLRRETPSNNSNVLSILCERYAYKLEHMRCQVEGKKQKDPLVSLMGPCVSCFELLFGQSATGGSDYKPTPFTLFAASFLERMDVPSRGVYTPQKKTANWRTVRRYFQKWQAHGSNRVSAYAPGRSALF